MAVRVCLESGARLVFASAVDWPGWCRSGRGEQAALEALSAYEGRYAEMVRLAGAPFVDGAADFDVVDRVTGTRTTDFGAPNVIAPVDSEPLTADQGTVMARLVDGCCTLFDRVVAQAPASLRKGPRGGGRDRDGVVEHVAAAELAYHRKLGLRLGKDLAGSRAALRTLLAAGSDGRPTGGGWPVRYGVRRTAWHVLDHAWEIQDRA